MVSVLSRSREFSLFLDGTGIGTRKNWSRKKYRYRKKFWVPSHSDSRWPYLLTTPHWSGERWRAASFLQQGLYCELLGLIIFFMSQVVAIMVSMSSIQFCLGIHPLRLGKKSLATLPLRDMDMQLLQCLRLL